MFYSYRLVEKIFKYSFARTVNKLDGEQISSCPTLRNSVDDLFFWRIFLNIKDYQTCNKMDLGTYLAPFRANSCNEDKFPELWLKSAQLFIPQMNSFVNLLCSPTPTINIEEYYNPKAERLAELFRSYGSDKASGHNYFIMYSHIIEQLGGPESSLNILEVGLGTANPSLVSTMGSSGQPGASLRAFRDYLPNSKVYGADIDRDILFTEDRIQTFFVDQLKIDSFASIPQVDGKFDLIIDDGLHSVGANLNTLLYGIQNVKVGGFVVIEDIANFNQPSNFYLVAELLNKSNQFKCWFVRCKVSHILVVQKL